MKRDEAKLRVAIVAEAMSWIGTPYVPESGEVKGTEGGVDCGRLLQHVFINAGAVPDFDIPHYAEQWHLHQVEEKYLGIVESFATEVAAPPERRPLPADIVLFRFGKCYAHGAIVIDWPRIVHIHRPRKCGLDDVAHSTIGKHSLAVLPKRYFSLWP